MTPLDQPRTKQIQSGHWRRKYLPSFNPASPRPTSAHPQQPQHPPSPLQKTTNCRNVRAEDRRHRRPARGLRRARRAKGLQHLHAPSYDIPRQPPAPLSAATPRWGPNWAWKEANGLQATRRRAIARSRATSPSAVSSHGLQPPVLGMCDTGSGKRKLMGESRDQDDR